MCPWQEPKAKQLAAWVRDRPQPCFTEGNIWWHRQAQAGQLAGYQGVRDHQTIDSKDKSKRASSSSFWNLPLPVKNFNFCNLWERGRNHAKPIEQQIPPHPDLPHSRPYSCSVTMRATSLMSSSLGFVQRKICVRERWIGDQMVKDPV